MNNTETVQRPGPDAISDDEGEFHEPSDEAYASFPLELHMPLLEGDTKSSRAWQELRATYRAIGQAVQRGIGDVVVHVRNLRAAGKTRFAVPAEKSNAKLGVPLPAECYTDEDLRPIAGFITSALRNSAVSEYVFSSVARRINNSEFTGEKLRGLLRGDATYPVLRNVGVMMRARNWRLLHERRIANGKEYLDVVIEIAALKPGLGRMRLICKGLHGRKIAQRLKVIKAIAALGFETSDDETKWSKGALTIRPLRRPGQPEKWMISLPYSEPRVTSAGALPVTVVVHRSVSNMLTAAISSGGGKETTFHHFPGRAIVAMKAQMYARRKPIQRDLSAMPHRGRGARKHFAALARLQDKERRATETNLWRAARWVQNIAEKAGASLILLDDFTSFDPDLPGPPFEPYVRRFPFAELKLKIIDALTRRGGFAVQEIRSAYISQQCPECGYIAKANIAKMPVVRGVNAEPGWFKCRECKFEADLDASAAMNLLKKHAARADATIA